MKHLLTYGGYLIALLTAGITLVINNPSTGSNNATVKTVTELNPQQDNTHTTAKQFEQIYAAKKAELAKLELELVAIYSKSAEITEAEYAQIQQQAEQRVTEELDPKQRNSMNAMMAVMDRAMQDEGRIRIGIETRVGVFLRELGLNKESYNQIVDQLVANQIESNGIRKRWRVDLLEDEKAKALLASLNQRTTLSQFLNEQQMHQYQQYLDEQKEKQYLISAQNRIAMAAPDISEAGKEILQSKLTQFFALNQGEDESASYFFQRRNNLLLQIESDITSQLIGEDLLAARRVLEEVRLSAKDRLARGDVQ